MFSRVSFKDPPSMERILSSVRILSISPEGDRPISLVKSTREENVKDGVEIEALLKSETIELACRLPVDLAGDKFLGAFVGERLALENSRFSGELLDLGDCIWVKGWKCIIFALLI
jgi:hypothetical protein